MKPLCYSPANLIRGKLSFTGVVSVTLNFHPPRKECRMMLLTRGKVEMSEAGRPGGSGVRAAKA